MDIQLHTDLATTVEVLTGLLTILGFFWKIAYTKRKDAIKKETDILIEKEKKLEIRLTRLEEIDNNQEVELKKLTDTCEMLKEENSRLKKDLLDNLDRLENRLEKMLDLIMTHFKSKED